MIKKDIQVQKTAKEMVEGLSNNYAEPTHPEVVAEVIEEIIVRLFFRIIKLNILSFGTIQFIHRYIMEIAPEDRVYELLRIYKSLQLQKLFNAGLISKNQLIEMSLNEKDFKYQVQDDVYHVNFDERFTNSYTTQVLKEEIMWTLYLIATNLNINETYFCYFYYELQNWDFDKSTLEKEVVNLIVRLKIREMRDKKFLTEDDETMFMSKIQESDLTYQFFTTEEIFNWRNKAFAGGLRKYIEKGGNKKWKEKN